MRFNWDECGHNLGQHKAADLLSVNEVDLVHKFKVTSLEDVWVSLRFLLIADYGEKLRSLFQLI